MSRLLLFGYGNPGRGDDILGTELIEGMMKLHLRDIECQNDMQLQIEHVVDLAACDRVLFLDADMCCSTPYVFSEIFAEKDDSYTSHAMSPAALLYAYSQVYGKNPPAAFLLRIRGYDFELGAPLSRRAAYNLGVANRLVHELCKDHSLQNWMQHLEKTVHEVKSQGTEQNHA